ncbi:hypothetical protein C0995_013954 [Termitomyces sp. Mi166|nr:hypothetical protein C0995_013954 [Termitomyces sp. Mi166\
MSGSVVREGLLTQPSFSEGEPAKAGASTLKRKKEITAALEKPPKSETDGSQAISSTLNRIVMYRLPRPNASSYLTTDVTIPYEDLRILEVAVRITDKDFNPLDNGVSFLVHWPEKDTLAAFEMIPVVVNMHRDSGLQHDYDNAPISDRKSLEHVEGLVCNYVKGHGINSGAIMAGSALELTAPFQRYHMPEFDKLFHYQVFDTTTLWHTIARRYGRQKRFKGSARHRAMDDINGAIRGQFIRSLLSRHLKADLLLAEAKFYTDLVFKALNLLRSSLSAPYPPDQTEKKPLDFNLDVVEGPPTSDQMRTILSYLPSKAVSPSHAFLSAHYATPSGSERPEGVSAIAKLAQDSPSALKWPIVVDWHGGQAAIGDVEGVKGILETLRKKRDGELKEDEVDQPKGWFT